MLIRGCTVVDGTGAPRFKAGVALRGDRIVAIGPGLIPSDGVVVVDAVPRVRITTGAFADLVIFDARPDSGPGDVHRPGSIPGRDRSPVHQRRPVIRLGALTGELPSRVIKGPARAQIPAYHE